MSTNSTPEKTFLVTGASGSNGRELIELFIAKGTPVRAMVRDRKKAEVFGWPGVETMEADFDQLASLETALKDVDAAFLLTPSSEKVEEQQLRFVELARQAGVKNLVYLSQLHADSKSSNRFQRYHAVVEEAIRESGLTYTFLRPNLFMQALLNFKSTIAEQSAFYAPAGDGRVSIVDVRDIAEIAFVSLTQPGHENKIYDITGPEALTHVEIAEQLSQALGKTIQFADIPAEQMHQFVTGAGFPLWQADGLVEEYELYWKNEAAVIGTGVQEALDRAPRNFADFAREYAEQFMA